MKVSRITEIEGKGMEMEREKGGAERTGREGRPIRGEDKRERGEGGEKKGERERRKRKK
jgi:hypothetical protein